MDKKADMTIARRFHKDPVNAVDEKELEERLLEDALLYDFYGQLLSERQQLIYETVRFQDLSYSEAAQELGISRQGVFEMIRRVSVLLHGYEELLGLVARFRLHREKGEEIARLCETYRSTRDDALLEQITQLAHSLKEDS